MGWRNVSSIIFSLKLYSSDLCKLIPFEGVAKASIELEECELEEAVLILTDKYKKQIKGGQEETNCIDEDIPGCKWRIPSVCFAEQNGRDA